MNTSRRVPVMLLARGLDLGGSERQMTEIAKQLALGRWEPHVACFNPNGLRGNELRAASIPVITVPVTSWLSPSAAAGIWKLGSYLMRRRIELVHAFDPPMSFFGCLTARLFRRPVVLSSQRGHRTLRPAGGRKLDRISDQLVDGIVVNCSAIKRHLIEDEKLPKDLIHVCYNGIDTGVFHPLAGPHPPELAAASLVIGTVCVLRPEKGLDTLLRAFAAMRGFRTGLRLAIVGSGPLLGPLQSLAAELGIGADCVFRPATDQVAKWLRAMDIFVLPSLSEALSNSLMEAMACGCCPVASDVGGTPELVRDGKTGLLFPCGDAVALAARLREVVSDDALRTELAAAAAAFIHKHFSIERAARCMDEIYAGLLGL